MRPRIPKFAAGGLAAIALAAAVGGAALAQTPPATPSATPRAGISQKGQDFLNALAAKLGKTPDELRAAIVGVEHDRVAQAVKDGRLTQQQADQLNRRIDQGGGLGFFRGPGFRGHGGAWGGPRVGAHVGFADVAQFLGIQPQDLVQQLRSGKSLAQVAQDHGKSRDDLKNYLTTQAKNRLSQAVQAGRLAQQQADQMLNNLSSRLDQMIDRTGPVGGPRGPFRRGVDGNAPARPQGARL